MTAKIYPYLTFENAREAMHYYVEQFGAEIIYRQPLSAEQAEILAWHWMIWMPRQRTVNFQLSDRKSSVPMQRWAIPRLLR